MLSVVKFRCNCQLAKQKQIVNGKLIGGPGTELTELLKSYGIEEKPSCSCRAVARQMDQWGVNGCRQKKNFDWIVERVKENARKYSWLETIIAATKAMSHPSEWADMLSVPFSSIPPSLVYIAIERARKKSEGT